MKTDDKYTDKGGAIRIVMQLVNDGPGGPEEVGYRMDGVPMQNETITINGKPTVITNYPRHFQATAAFLAECQPVPVFIPAPPVIEANEEPTPVALPPAGAPQRSPKRR